MRRPGFSTGIVYILLVLAAIWPAGKAFAQNTSVAILRGHVADQTGAVIPGATITLRPGTGAPLTTQSSGDGAYIFHGVPAGTYTMTVDAPGFASYSKPELVLGRAQSMTLDIPLDIQVQTQQVVVTDQSTALDTNPDSNASAMILKDKDLEALSDDPDELANELQALAGPSAGPNGGQIYVDGFTGGQLPPKSAIREIRINQNPFSAQYDLLGYGRIEILTKPGTDKYHGQFLTSYNSSSFNTGNPFTKSLPAYNNLQFSGYASGPMGKNASFFVGASRRNIQDDSIINTTILDPNFNPIIYIPAGILNPQVRIQYSPRVDLQIGQKNTLTMRLQYTDATNPNAGIGGNNLPSLAYSTDNAETELQIGDTQIISDRIINETRFEYGRNRSKQVPQSFDPETTVQGALATGGNSIGTQRDALDRYEVQNYTSIALKNNFIRFGGRLRAQRDSNYSTGGYNGIYTFGPVSYNPSNPSLSGQCGAANAPAGCVTNTGIEAYATMLKGQAAGLTPEQIRANGGGPTQYNVTVGTPVAKLMYDDLGVYAEDDWKARPNFTLSYGLRFETQSSIKDKADFGPRIAMAWGIGGDGKKPPKTVLRAGYGIFYTRFSAANVMQAQRVNGLPGSQQKFIITNPNFYPTGPASLAGATTTSPTIYSISPKLHAAYTMQTGGTLERTLSKTATVALTYLNSRGVHQYVTLNINAPLPGTYIPGTPNSGIRPYGNNDNLYQYTSEGVFNQNQLIANTRIQANKYVSLAGFYIFSVAKADATNNGFPTNSYNISQDYGYANFDVRNRAILFGNISLPYQINLSPFIIANSGSPFNITTGQDLNGDSIYNDRPAFAGPDSSPNVKDTPYGNFDLNPTPGETLIPHNYARGPNRFVFNLRAAKAFGFGPKTDSGPGAGGPGGGPGGGGGHGRGPGGGLGMAMGGNRGGPRGAAVNRKYALNLSVQAMNVFNDINLANPVGTLSSPQFGESTQMATGIFSMNAASRRIYMQAVFSF